MKHFTRTKFITSSFARPCLRAFCAILLGAGLLFALVYALVNVTGAREIDLQPKQFEIWVTNQAMHKYGRVNLLSAELNSVQSVLPSSGFTNAIALNAGERGYLATSSKAVLISNFAPEDITPDTESLDLDALPPDEPHSSAHTPTGANPSKESGIAPYTENGADLRTSSASSDAAQAYHHGVQYTATSSPDGVYMESGGVATLLEHSAPSSGATYLNRGLRFHQTAEHIALSAGVSGEVWILEGQAWKVVPSTLNGWERQSSAPALEQAAQADVHNICPTPEHNTLAEFGVRPGRLNQVPLTLGIRDANWQDQVYISRFDYTQSDENAFLSVQISDDRQSIVTKVSDVTSGSIHIIAHITDGGMDAKGVCDQAFEFDISVHPYSQNQAPQQPGRPFNLDDLTLYTAESVLSQNLLNSWVDPDGDDIALIEVSADQNLDAIANPSGDLTVRALSTIATSSSSYGLRYQVTDAYGAATPGDLSILYDPEREFVPQSYTLQALNGVPLRASIADQLARRGKGLRLEDVNCPPALECRILDDVSLTINPHQTGAHILSYGVQGTSARGQIKLNVLAPEQDFPVSISSPSITLMDVSDTLVNLQSLIQNQPAQGVLEGDTPEDILEDKAFARRTFAKSVKVVPQRQDDAYQSSPSARLEAKLVAASTLQIEAQALENAAQPVIFAGSVEVLWQVSHGGGVTPSSIPSDVPNYANGFPIEGAQSVAQSGSEECISRINVFISLSPPQRIIPGQGFVSVAPGEMVDVDVLADVHTSYAADLVLDEAVIIDQDFAKGLAYVANSKLRYIAPADMPDQVLVPYAVYIKGYYASSYAKGVLLVQRRGEQSSTSLALENATQEYLEPFARYDQVYFGTQDSVTLDLRQSAYAPPGTSLSFERARLRIPGQDSAESRSSLPEEGISAEVSEVGISEAKVTLPVQHTGKVAVWEVRVNVQCAVDSSVCTSGDLLTTYTHYLVLRPSTEPSPQSMPKARDYAITTDDLQSRSSFVKDFAEQVYGFAGTPQFELVEDLSRTQPEKPNFEASTLYGRLGESAQVLLYRASMPDDPTTRAYGVIAVMPQHSVVPKRSDSEVFSVKSGDTLAIGLPQRVQKLDGARLEMIPPAQRALSTLQSECRLDGDTLLYTADANVYESGTVDECWIEARFSGEQTTAVLRFKVRVIPQNTSPELKAGVVLPALRPKEQRSVVVSDHISWLGHTRSEIEGLELKCTGDAEAQAYCEGAQIHLEVVRSAEELSWHDINVEITGYPVAVKWRLRVEPAAKVGDLDLGEHSESVTLTESSGGSSALASADLVSPVKELLESQQLYGLQKGAYVRCGASTHPHLRCKEGARFGVLDFWVEGALPGGGFETLASYTFADRADVARANVGSGTVRVKYRALPKVLSIVKVDLSSARSGYVQIEVAETEPYSVPGLSQICLNVLELGTSVCKPGSAHAVTFNSYDYLTMLSAWSKYTFNAYSVNEVGTSDVSTSVHATPFTPLLPFNIWSEDAFEYPDEGEPSSVCMVHMSGVDPNIASWQVQSELGVHDFSTTDALKAYLSDAATQISASTVFKVIGLSRVVSFTGLDFTPQVAVDLALRPTQTPVFDSS